MVKGAQSANDAAGGNVIENAGQNEVKTSTKSLRVWDLPTRVFHWSLALSFIALVVTGNMGNMVWHARLGFFILSLLLFRIVWGFAGGHWSRFSQFIYSPMSVLRYVSGRGEPEHKVGHNPLAMFSVFALFFLLGLQVVSGLGSSNEVDFEGPLTKWISYDTVALFTNYHQEVGKLILIALVVLHLLALLYYRLVKRQKLVKSMLTGDKEVDAAYPYQQSFDNRKTRFFALTIYAFCAAFTYVLSGM